MISKLKMQWSCDIIRALSAVHVAHVDSEIEKLVDRLTGANNVFDCRH